MGAHGRTRVLAAFEGDGCAAELQQVYERRLAPTTTRFREDGRGWGRSSDLSRVRREEGRPLGPDR
jgi:hypothetical protein